MKNSKILFYFLSLSLSLSLLSCERSSLVPEISKDLAVSSSKWNGPRLRASSHFPGKTLPARGGNSGFSEKVTAHHQGGARSTCNLKSPLVPEIREQIERANQSTNVNLSDFLSVLPSFESATVNDAVFGSAIYDRIPTDGQSSLIISNAAWRDKDGGVSVHVIVETVGKNQRVVFAKLVREGK